MNISTCPKGGAPQCPRDRSLCTQDASGSFPMCVCIWLFICILCKKLVNINTLSSWALWVLLANHRGQRGGSQDPLICSQSVRSTGVLDLTTDMWPSYETEPLTCGSVLTASSVRTELNCWTSNGHQRVGEVTLLKTSRRWCWRKRKTLSFDVRSNVDKNSYSFLPSSECRP